MKKETINWKFHPRVFNSLGADLVTDDTVAIIELVKNAYDAGANEVNISFLKDSKEEKLDKKKSDSNTVEKIILEIRDNGQGMTKKIIEDVWFTVATPYKVKNKAIKIDKETSRTVSGEKGLGRLSTARLGNYLEIYTKSTKEPCWKVSIDWNTVANSSFDNPIGGTIEEADFPYPNSKSGTVLRIANLYDVWFQAKKNNNETENEEKGDDDKIEILENNLSRFVSPFRKIKETGNFRISITNPISESKINIQSPSYLDHPIYVIKGYVQEDGSITYQYKYNDGDRKNKKKSIIKANEISKLKLNKNNIPETFCGAFQFEVRVWDVDTDSTELFTKRFNINKIQLKEQISFHKGISVYRDGVLVLPKTMSSRDWLGLDLRRISRVGKRISNRQIIGYVSITEDQNKGIEDASNREGFKDTKEVRVFKKYLTKIVETLEQLRENDKLEMEHKEPPFSDVLTGILPTELKDRIEVIVKEKGTYNDILQAVREHESKANDAHEKITQRAYYYSRLASIGTLASFLIHEIRNRTGTISDLHIKLREPNVYEKVIKYIEKILISAEDAVDALEVLSNTFSPLAIKKPNPKKMICDPVEMLNTSLSPFKSEIKKKGITVVHNQTSVNVKIYPGEMGTIFYNLFSNSVYWLSSVVNKDKSIKIHFKLNSEKDRLIINFSDSGPGIVDGTEDKIFWPGWTKRNDGFGMGLTVASELVSQYGGKMSMIKPGELGGLTLRFDLPIYTESKR